MIQVGKPVKGTSFIGRDKEVNDIMRYLKMGQSVVVVAPRRFGKTSLVLEILRRLKKEKWYTGSVDLFEHPTLVDLAPTIVEEVLENHGLKHAYQKARGSIMALLKNIKLKAVVDDFQFLLGMEDGEMDAFTRFDHALDFINDFPERAQKSMVFSFDEYGDILKYEQANDIIKLMRAKIQKQDTAVYLFSGSYESVMDALFANRKGPFYRLARKIELGYLPFESVQKYMIKMLKTYEVDYDLKLIQDSIDFLKGHPYYCQLALQQMYLYHMTQKKAPTFDTLLDIIVNADRSYLEKIWEDLSSNKESVFILKHLSKEPEGIYAMASERKINASRALKTLEGQGIIYRKSKGYFFYDPVFEYWVATTIYA